MKVVSVVNFPVFGGPHNRNAWVANRLVDEGVTTVMVLPDDPGNAVDRLRERGVHVRSIRLARLRTSRDVRVQVRSLAGVGPGIARLRAVMREEQPDVVLVNGLPNPHAAIAARLEGIPVVWQILDTFPPAPYRWAMMQVVRRTAPVIMTSGMATAAVHPGALAYGERLINFFPAVDTARFATSGASKRAARRALGLDDDDVVVGNVNNITLMKGHRWFVRGAAELRKTHPDVKFVVLGASSPWHKSYTDGLWAEAEVLGLRLGTDLIVRDPGAGVAELAVAFDLFWLTSEPRSEGLSTVVGEAMSLGQPVVAADIGALRESVADNVTGYIVPPRSPEALAEASRDLVNDPALRSTIGAAGRRRAKALYSVEAVAAAHLAAYRAAIVNGPCRARRPV